ncbi:MAG: hypothetical protein AAF348_19145 [Bacteroidota bacterium]
MGNTAGLKNLLSVPKKDEVEKKEKNQKSKGRTTSRKSSPTRKIEKELIKAENKVYRSFYITDDTSNLVNRVVNTIKIDNSKYNNDMAIYEAFKLLAEANGVKI